MLAATWRNLGPVTQIDPTISRTRTEKMTTGVKTEPSTSTWQIDPVHSSAPQKDPWGNTRIGLSATTRINRRDFGLTWNTVLETGGFLVGDDVTITLDIEFVKT